MGFHTTVYCYRAGSHPPIVTPADLADFCQRVVDLDIVDPDSLWGVQLKYGRTIDQDDRSTSCEEQVGKNSFLMLEYDWDVDEYMEFTPTEAVQLLKQPPKPQPKTVLSKLFPGKATPANIYRAHIGLGDLREEFTTTIQHELEGNCLFLGELYFYIDVIEIKDPNERNSFEVGWMALGVGGNGYPFPWSYEETLQRVREHPQLNALRELCRTLWPASQEPLRKDDIEARRLMGKYWAEPLDAPYDWYWAIQGAV